MANQVDIAIVGAGPVGLTLANLLGEYGVRCALIEQNPGTSAHPRAQTIDDESMRTLQSFGCAATFAEKTRPAAGSNYYDENGERFGHVGAGPSNYGFFKRNYMLQQELDALLFDHLSQYPEIEQRFSTRLESFVDTKKRVELTLANGETLTCRFLIACDGGQSPIRRALGVQMQGWTYEQDWIVLDMLDDPDTDPVSRFICDPARPAVSIASPGNGRRYEFMLSPGEIRDEVLTDENLTKLLKPFRPFDPAKATRRAVYTFHARIADQLRVENTLLLGDAAHLTPPFAGQGMNAGIRDAQNLAWKLALVCMHGADPALLDTYEKERRDPIWAMIQIAVAMGEFVMPVGQEQVALKNSVLKALERFPQARDWLFQMRFKPKPRYTDGAFVELDDQALEASLVGEMLPQPAVLDETQQVQLLDSHLGSGFCLLGPIDALTQIQPKLATGIWKKLDLSLVALNWPSQQAMPDDSVDGITRIEVADGSEPGVDAQNLTYARPIRTHRDQVILIRPDRYVAGAFFVANFDAFTTKLASALGMPE